ncbi:hypothetical protein A2125_00280 [Candidatus Woesebacteria bacterium GWB1_43_5]|uniref:Methyltransferase type 11 domain-containing protein n=1 Tax=Candidatus Woesebacteria bacterium GWB1_43_5 TaxID=1802474 RepID=A0A1F7WRX6_9BACT|nr:MAG: hypothetical protein A2125_00280 [Candidatus Woesebacteria bacterium GWB1_43_5]
MRKAKLVCPTCKRAVVKKFWAMPRYRLARCSTCGLVWDFSITREDIDIYKKKYFANEDSKGGYANYFEGMRVNRRTFADRLVKLEQKLGKKGKLLDVGCALGECLIEAKNLGWKGIEGVELSEFACRFARNRGLKIKRGVLGNSYAANSFDAVVYQDVIEHIPDPVGELKKARRVLRHGGIIFLVTPDIGGFWSKLLGARWYHFKPREHLIYFSQSSMRSALGKAGFSKIETAGTYHILSIEYIVNRLKYYFPSACGMVLAILRKTPLKDIPVKSYTGELEAWGKKL